MPIKTNSPDTPSATNQIEATPTENLAIPGKEDEESKVRKLHAELLALGRTSLEFAIEAGDILAALKTELRNAVPKRKWQPYVRDHLGIDPRTASNYMRLYRRFSDIESIGTAKRTEMISDTGIRKALDYLAEIDKAARKNSGRKKAGGDTKRSKASSSNDPIGPPPLRLADGRSLDLGQLHWKDGLISSHVIGSWLSRFEPDAADPKAEKQEARRQQAVVHIAAGINRACGRARPDVAKELAMSAIEVVQRLLEKTTAQ